MHLQVDIAPFIAPVRRLRRLRHLRCLRRFLRTADWRTHDSGRDFDRLATGRNSRGGKKRVAENNRAESGHNSAPKGRMVVTHYAIINEIGRNFKLPNRRILGIT
jgi:hypothetical protein